MAQYVTKLDFAEMMILQLITSGEIGAGDRLPQNELASRLGVSSTPVREALRRLEAQGLLVRDPHRGVRVAEVDADAMAELYMMRAVLEGLATEHAVANLGPREIGALQAVQDRIDAARARGSRKPLRELNDEFHSLLCSASRLPRLNRLIESLRPLFPWDAMWAVPGRAITSAAEHRAILDTIRQGEAGKAGEAMRSHIESGGRALAAHISATGGSRRGRRTQGSGVVLGNGGGCSG